MKDKILYLVIGILIGAMVTTGVFMIVNKNSNNNQNNFNRGNFDSSNMPEGFDPNNLPEGFDVNNIPEGGPAGQRWNNQGTIDSSQTDSI